MSPRPKIPLSYLLEISGWGNMIGANNRVSLYNCLLDPRRLTCHISWAKWFFCSPFDLVYSDREGGRVGPLISYMVSGRLTTWNQLKYKNNFISILYSFRLQSSTFSFFQMKLLQKYHINTSCVNCLFLEMF